MIIANPHKLFPYTPSCPSYSVKDRANGCKLPQQQLRAPAAREVLKAKGTATEKCVTTSRFTSKLFGAWNFDYCGDDGSHVCYWRGAWELVVCEGTQEEVGINSRAGGGG